MCTFLAYGSKENAGNDLWIGAALANMTTQFLSLKNKYYWNINKTIKDIQSFNIWEKANLPITESKNFRTGKANTCSPWCIDLATAGSLYCLHSSAIRGDKYQEREKVAKPRGNTLWYKVGPKTLSDSAPSGLGWNNVHLLLKSGLPPQ